MIYEEETWQNQNGSHTLLRCLPLGSRGIAQEVSKFGSNCNLMLLEGFGVKPHEARAVHMLQESDLILVGNVSLISVMLLILAELMGIITLFPGEQKYMQMPAPSFSMLLLGNALEAGVPFFTWNKPIFRLLSENSFLSFFCPPCCSLPFGLRFPPLVPSAGWEALCFLASPPFGSRVNPPPVALMKQLLAKAGTS